MSKYLKLSEVQELLSLSDRSVRRLVADGTLPAPVKLGGARRWNEDEIKQYLQKLRGPEHAAS